MRRPQGDAVVVPLNRISEFARMGPVRRFRCLPAAMLPAEVGGGCGAVLTKTPQLQVLKFWRKAIVKEYVGMALTGLAAPAMCLKKVRTSIFAGRPMGAR